jgi:hypothetical protein
MPNIRQLWFSLQVYSKTCDMRRGKHWENISLKGLWHEFFGLVFFMSQHLIGPWWMSRNSSIFFCEFAEIFKHVWLSTDYLRNVRTFRKLNCKKAYGYNSQKVKTFRGLFCVKIGFSKVKSTENFDFSRTILRKGMPFSRIIAESQNIPRIILRKSMPFSKVIRGKWKLSVNYPVESFSILQKSQSNFLKAYHYFYR